MALKKKFWSIMISLTVPATETHAAAAASVYQGINFTEI
jgi:hypothetical protein